MLILENSIYKLCGKLYRETIAKVYILPVIIAQHSMRGDMKVLFYAFNQWREKP